jgi:hypothetical protein
MPGGRGGVNGTKGVFIFWTDEGRGTGRRHPSLEGVCVCVCSVCVRAVYASVVAEVGTVHHQRRTRRGPSKNKPHEGHPTHPTHPTHSAVAQFVVVVAPRNKNHHRLSARTMPSTHTSSGILRRRPLLHPFIPTVKVHCATSSSSSPSWEVSIYI